MILLDTSILSDILRKKADIIMKMIKIEAHPLATCEICVMELYFGVYANKTYENNPSLMYKRISAINGLIKRLTIFNFNRTSAIKTAELMGKLKMKGSLIDFRDGMIAGIALANGINEILTHNTSHFERIGGIIVI